MTTPNFSITELAASQAQKYVTVNEALRVVDTAMNLTVIRTDNTAPPGSPSEGDKYIPLATATGTWAGRENNIAAYINAEWIFFTPAEGWRVYDQDTNELLIFDGSSWGNINAGYLGTTGGTLTGDLALEEASPSIRFGDTDISGDTLIQTNGVDFQVSVDYNNVDADSTFQVLIDGNTKAEVNQYGLGVGGSSADATNAFTFYGTNLLLNNSGSSIDMKYNKNASGNDASMTFQTAFSTKALMGLLGNDNFTIKVGGSFNTALVADETTGTVYFPNSLRLGGDSSANELDDYEEGNWTPTMGSPKGGDYASATGLTVEYAKYVKVGRKVDCWVGFSVAGVGTGAFTQKSSMTISGLPFTAANFSASSIEMGGVTGFVYKSIGGAVNSLCQGGVSGTNVYYFVFYTGSGEADQDGSTYIHISYYTTS